MDTDAEFLDEPNEHLIALNCGSPANIAHYIATLHREIAKLLARCDDLEAKVRALRGLPPTGTGMP